MVRLTILKEDGSVYWKEHFATREHGEAWLAEEQTRSYWEPTFEPQWEEIPEVRPAVDPWAILRAQRNARLATSDWTQLADAPIEDAEILAWRHYRQALRDLPENTPDPANPTWPAEPSSEPAPEQEG